jgi:cell division protein FtsQ
LIFFFFFAALATLVITLPVFRVQSVLVEGDRLLTEGEILKTAALPLGENIFLIRFGQASRRLENDPVIKKVDFIRRLPDTIIVQVAERREVAVTVMNERSVLIDESGYVFIPTNFPDISRLPVLTGLRKEYIYRDHLVGPVGEGLIKLLADFVSLISPTKLQVDVSNPEEINLLVDDTLRIKIGEARDLERKIKVFEAIFRRVKDQKDRIEYLDLRFPAFPAVKFK